MNSTDREALVTRLRATKKQVRVLNLFSGAVAIPDESETREAPINPDGPEAADLIEALSRPSPSGEDVERLREALKPFAAFDDGRAPEHLPITSGSRMARRQLTIGDCRRAAAALSLPHKNGEVDRG